MKKFIVIASLIGLCACVYDPNSESPNCESEKCGCGSTSYTAPERMVTRPVGYETVWRNQETVHARQPSYRYVVVETAAPEVEIVSNKPIAVLDRYIDNDGKTVGVYTTKDDVESMRAMIRKSRIPENMPIMVHENPRIHVQ